MQLFPHEPQFLAASLQGGNGTPDKCWTRVTLRYIIATPRPAAMSPQRRPVATRLVRCRLASHGRAFGACPENR